jgi:predicted DNA-binding WGR domain protein
MAKKQSKPAYYEFRDGESHKFWEISIDGSSHTVRFGRCGTDGQARTKSFASPAEAKASYEKLVKEKTGKGYAVASRAAPKKVPKGKAAKLAKKRVPAKTARVSVRAAKKKKVRKKSSPLTAATNKKAQKKKAAPRKKNTIKAAVKVSHSADSSTPKLYMLEHDVFDGKRWTSEVLVANYLDVDYDDWWKQAERATKKAVKPLPVIVERHGKSNDFCPTTTVNQRVKFSSATASSESGWTKLEPLLGVNARTIPVITTRETKPDQFGFQKLAANKQTKHVLVDPSFVVPFRHGQSFSWDSDRRTFDPTHREKSLPKVPMIDPQEFSGTHLFRLQYPVYVVATETFVQAYRDAKLTGLAFHEFDYLPTPQVRPPAAKKVLDAMPKYPSSLVKKGWSKPLGKQWEQMWDWATKGLKNRSWPAKTYKKKPPVPKSKLNSFEQKYGVTLPPRLRAVLEQYAAAAEIDHGVVKPSDPISSHRRTLDNHVGTFMFAGKQVLWDFSEMAEIESFQEWLEDVKEIGPDEMQCVPILTVGNGDQVTVDLITEEIRYWSHDGDERLDQRLAVDIVDFITRWSWLGVPSIDFLPSTPFYDAKKKCLQASDTQPVRRWHAWLQGHELDALS